MRHIIREHLVCNTPFLIRYVVIGAIVFMIDVGSFQLFLHAHAMLALAATGSFAASVSTHFTLNRLWNFRNFDRSSLAQLRTYAIVVGLQYVISLSFIEVAVALGQTAIVAKICSIALNFPIGFFGHRYLTFGAGISATVKRLLAARVKA